MSSRPRHKVPEIVVRQDTFDNSSIPVPTRSATPDVSQVREKLDLTSFDTTFGPYSYMRSYTHNNDHVSEKTEPEINTGHPTPGNENHTSEVSKHPDTATEETKQETNKRQASPEEDQKSESPAIKDGDSETRQDSPVFDRVEPENTTRRDRVEPDNQTRQDSPVFDRVEPNNLTRKPTPVGEEVEPNTTRRSTPDVIKPENTTRQGTPDSYHTTQTPTERHGIYGDDNDYQKEEKNLSKPTSPVTKTRRLSQTSGISAASRNSQRKSSLNRRLSQTSGISAVSKHLQPKSSLSKTPGSFLNHALYQDSFNTEKPPSNPHPTSRLDNGLKSKTPKSKLSMHAHHSKKSNRRMSKNAPLLNTTSYYHGDFIDENLLISATKLDSTLIRLFSQTRDKHNDLERRASDDKLIPYLNYLESDLISMDAVLWRVHPMEAAHRVTLEQELPFIEDNIQPREVIRDLYQDEILTHMDFTQFTRTEGQGERAVNRLLVKTLQRRGDKAYPAFVDVLKKLDYTHVCDRLRDTEAVIRQGMKEDSSDLARRTEEENLRQLHRPMVPNTPFTVVNTPFTVVNTPGYDSDKDTDETHRPLAYNLQTVPTTTELAVDQTVLDSHVMDSKVLEQHLRDLSAELQALQHDVSALRTLQESRTSEDLTVKDDADLDSLTLEAETPEAIITVDEKSKSQKSGSCSIL